MLCESTRQDLPKLLALYPQALPEEDLKPVVSALTDGLPDILSIAGFNLDASVAHVLFTICGTDPDDRSGALLAPLGVMQSHRQQGHGTALVHEGLKRLRARGTGRVFVLGDPDHYRQFGFTAEWKSLAPTVFRKTVRAPGGPCRSMDKRRCPSGGGGCPSPG